MARLVILGIGNALLTDGGAGVHAAQSLQTRAAGRADLRILDAGTLSFPLLGAFSDADALIAIDASRVGARPGELTVREGEDFDRFICRGGRSAEEAELASLLETARRAGRLPAQRVLIAVEPKVVDWGLELSPDVAAALPRCVDVALEFIDRWHPREPAAAH